MNRTELVGTVARDAGLTAAQAEAAVSTALDAIVAAVAAGDRVTLAAFGTFEARERAARSGRNPQTGDPIEIPASVAPAFKPAAAFKEAVARR